MAHQYFLCKGPWKNWEWSLNDAAARNVDTVRWGTEASSGPDLANYNSMNNGDKVFFANNATDPGPFGKSVLFGFGNVVEKIVGTEPYWPDEKKKNKVIWKYRFDVKRTFVAEETKDTIKWFNGLPVPKGFSPIRNTNVINKLEAGFSQHGAKPTSTFKFVEKDFVTPKIAPEGERRRRRFVQLFDALAPKLGPRFDVVKKDIGLSVESTKRKNTSYFGRYNKRGTKKPTVYTWFGIMLHEPTPNPTANKSDFRYAMKDVVQFQVGINPKDPLWAGIYIGRGIVHTRKNLLELLKDQKEKCLNVFKGLPEGYIIRIYSRKEHLGDWPTKKLNEEEMDEIYKAYKKGGTDFRVCRLFSKNEALKP